VLLQGLPGWRGVELHDVEIVGLHPFETLFDPRHHVLAGEDVWPSLIARSRGRADQTSAFAGQIIFSAPGARYNGRSVPHSARNRSRCRCN
jgi:hypothetical protein